MASLIYITYYEENQSTLFQFAMIGDSWSHGSESFILVGSILTNPVFIPVYQYASVCCVIMWWHTLTGTPN